jgi:hypothetical protein
MEIYMQITKDNISPTQMIFEVAFAPVISHGPAMALLLIQVLLDVRQGSRDTLSQ